LSTLSVEKVATPATAAAVVVPESLAPLVPVPVVIVSVTLPVNPVTVLPNASCAVSCTGGLIAAPAVAVVGCMVKTSRVAGALVMSNGALVVPAGPAATADSV